MATLIFCLLVHLNVEVPNLRVGKHVGRQTGIRFLRRDYDAIFGDEIATLSDYLGTLQKVARNNGV